MNKIPRSKPLVVGGAIIGIVGLLTGCAPPGTGGSDTTTQFSAIDAPVTVDDVAELGDVTLKVWADSGEKATLEDYVPAFEKKYPNVTVEVTLKSFDDLVKTVVNAMDSKDAPDLAQGNQGYAVDGTLVKAKLIRPLDDVAKAYGWEEIYSPYSLNQFRWLDDGTKWGEGTLYGNSPVTQYVGVFENKSLLEQANVPIPVSFDEMEESLPKIKAAGITPIVFGNSDKQPAMHLFGSLAGRCQSADVVNDWVAGAEGATFVNECNTQAAQTIVDWVKAGYVSDGFNGVSMDDAANRFAQGDGAYYIGGDWLLPQIAAVGGNFGFTTLTGDNGKRVSTGSSSVGWHISSKSEVTPAAIAFLGGIHDPSYSQKLADQNRVPMADASATSSDQLMAEDIAASALLLGDNGQTAYLDWATDTMYDVFGSGLQELMAEKITPEQFVEIVQADWEAFQAE